MQAGALEKRSMRIAGHRTSLALEPEFWAALEQAARRVGLSLPKIVEKIDEGRARERPAASLASAVRVFLLGARA